MFGKRCREQEPEPLERRLRSNVADLFLSNTISANRTHSLLEDANAAGNAACQELLPRTAGSTGRHRDILARLLRGWQWPKPYTAQIPVWDSKLMQKKRIIANFAAT